MWYQMCAIDQGEIISGGLDWSISTYTSDTKYKDIKMCSKQRSATTVHNIEGMLLASE